MHAGGIEFLEDFLRGSAVQQRVHLLRVGEHERQIPHLNFLKARGERRQGTDVEFLCPGLHALQLLFVTSEHGIVERLDLHVVICVLGRQFDKFVHCLCLRMAIWHGVT